MTTQTNPFRSLLRRPASDDPDDQLQYLLEVLEALDASDVKRIESIRNKVYATMMRIAAAAKRGPQDSAPLLEQVERSLSEIKIDTFSLLGSVLNELRVRLHHYIQIGQVIPPTVDLETLERGLNQMANASRKLVSALRRRDTNAEAAAMAVFERAGQTMASYAEIFYGRSEDGAPEGT